MGKLGRHFITITAAFVLSSGTFAFGINFGPVEYYNAPTEPLWINDENGQIGTFNFSNDQVTIIGSTGLGASLTDIAFTSNGNLYGTTPTALYSINETTAAVTLIANYGNVTNGIVGLVGDGSMLLAGSGNSPDLYLINPNPSSFSITDLTNATPGAGYNAGDMAFSPSGTSVFETLTSGQLQQDTILGDTVTSTIIGNLAAAGGAAQDNVYGLATGNNGVVYAISDTEIYSVTTSTGSLTPFFDYSATDLGDVSGSAFPVEGTLPAAVPEPATPVLLGFGMAALLLYFRRRRAAVR